MGFNSAFKGLTFSIR